jgi:preprotein translocase subunit SecE
VARDRQRAKQRKARRSGQNPGPRSSEPHRSNLPGGLEHSGDSDEFDAALVAGAGGHTADETREDAGDDLRDDAGDDPRDDAGDTLIEDERVDGAERLDDDEIADGVYEDEIPDDNDDEDLDDDPADEELAREAVAAGSPARSRRHDAAPRTAAHPAPRGPGRFLAFLRASWAELQRVQWPDRRQVAQATAVVLGFVVVAGLYLGLADRVAQELVDLIL